MAVQEKWKNTRPMSISTEEAVDRVLQTAKRDKKVFLLYLFGSRATGHDKSTSDIDFAFFSSKDFSWNDYYLLHGSITKILGTDRANFLWLNKADPVITFEVIATGRILYYKDTDTLNDFELKARKNYYDYKFYLEKHRRGL